MSFESINAEPLAELSNAAVDLASYEKLVECELLTVPLQKKFLAEAKANDAAMDSQRNAALQRKEIAERQISALRAQLDDKRRTAIGATSTGYASFLTEIGKIQEDLQMRQSLFTHMAQYTPTDLRYVDVDRVVGFVDGWVGFVQSVSERLTRLEEQGRLLHGNGARSVGLEDIQDLLTSTREAYNKVSGNIARERARRRDYSDSLAEFVKNQQRLIQWCRSQRSTLESLHDADHIQEFCTSLQNNVSIMETNFLVLMELSEPLVPNRTVEQALIEVNEVWLSLAVFSFEKLRTVLLEAHAASGLQHEAQRWCVQFADNLKKFLQDAEKLLLAPTDEESKRLTQPTLVKCQALLTEHDPHSVIVEHVSDFTLREDCLKEHYSAIRRTIFSKLTLLTQSFHLPAVYPRKQEYNDRLAELTDWVECKSQTDAWKQLLSRVGKMKQLVEENEARHGTIEERH
jgi:hypothetical protein